MNSQSIEFDKINEDSSLPEIVRKSFRVPVEDNENIWVVINAKRYSLLDISLGGIGIVLDDTSAFTVAQTLKNCELNIFDVSIKELNGRVVHLSSDFGTALHCGIEWIDMQEKRAGQISKIIETMKKKLLEDDNISFDSV